MLYFVCYCTPKNYAISSLTATGYLNEDQPSMAGFVQGLVA